MSRKSNKTPLIYALEPRLLFDGDLGADAAAAIVYRDGNGTDVAAVAPENQRDTQSENLRAGGAADKEIIIFIDGALQDSQTLIDAAPENAEIHILNASADGFSQMADILDNHDRVDEIHIFGHGLAGEARLGTASLSLHTLNTHRDSLAVLKNALHEDGDILLYGCDVAAGEDGQVFIEELAELTAADIAASDDVTGAGGDWDLEFNVGSIEAETIVASDYQHSLTPNGVTSLTNTVDRTQSNLIVKARPDFSRSERNSGRGFYDQTSAGRFVIALEKENITSADTLYFDFNVAATNGFTVNAQNPVNSYLIALNDDIGRRDSGQATIVFEYEILGYYADKYNTLGSGAMQRYSEIAFSGQGDGDSRVTQISNSYFANSSWTYPTSQIGKRDSEGYFNTAFGNGASGGADYVWTTNNNTLKFAAKNGDGSGTGDFIRVITRASVPNSAPTVTSATDVSGSVTELADGHANENTATLTDTGYFTIADSDGDTVSVSRAFSSTTRSNNSAFGDLTPTIANNTTTDGTGQINWTYSVDDSALDALDAGESYTETWVITVSDGTASTTRNVTVTINGAADPVLAAKNDYAWVNEGENVSVANDQTTTGATGGMTNANSSTTITDFSGGMERFDFNNDGSKLYVNDYSTGDYKQYSLSTPFDVSTAQADNIGDSLEAPNGYYNITFNDTGSKAFILNYSTDYIREYNLSTAYDITTASFVRDQDVGSYDTTPSDLAFSSDGSKLFLLGSTNDKIYQLNLSTPYDISVSSNGGSFALGDYLTSSSVWGMVLSPDGKKLFVADDNEKVHEFFLPVANDVTTASFLGYTDVSSLIGSIGGIAFNNDGSKFYASDRNSETIVTYNTSVPFSVQSFLPGGNTGDVLHTTRYASKDTGTDLSVNGFRVGGVEGQGTYSHSNNGSLESEYGTLTMQLDGSYSYQANNNISGLDAGEVVYDHFNYRAKDSNNNNDTAVLTFTIVGVDNNTAPTMTSDTLLHTFTEADDAAAQALSATGTITLSDDDATNLSVASYQTLASTVTLGGGLTSIPSALQTALEADNALSISHNTGDTTATWTFNVAAQDLDFLKYGETITVEETIQINDNQGGSITETIQVVIQGRDDKPTSANVVRTINENDTYTFLASDFTRIDVDSGTQEFDLEIEAPTNGTLRVNGSDISSGGVATVPFDDLFADSVTFTPDTDASGQNYSTVTFRIASDQIDQDVALGDGSDVSQDYTFTFHVNGAPTASDETVYINEKNRYNYYGTRTPSNTYQNFSPSDFASFSDPEDSSFSNLKITSLETDGALQYFNGSSLAHVTENQIISYSLITNRLVFYPDDNAENDVSFGFQLSDSAGVYSAEQTMTISVNAAPTASDYVEGGSGIDAGATDTGNIKDNQISDGDDTDDVLVLTGLIAGDEHSNWENSRADFITDGTGIGTDVVGLYGTLQIASNGDFTYTANASNDIPVGQTAQDDFTYTVRDDETNAGSYAYDVGTISFSVNASNHAPVAADTSISVAEDRTTTGASLADASLIGPTENTIAAGGYQTGHETVDPESMFFSPDGSKLFVLGAGEAEPGSGNLKRVITYNLTNPWDVSAWTLDNPIMDLTPHLSNLGSSGWPKGLAFNDDGTVMIVLVDELGAGDGPDHLLSFNLSTAYDTSTASYDEQVFIANTGDSASNPGSIDLNFSEDGREIFIFGSAASERKLSKFTLSTPWDISTIDMNNPSVHNFDWNNDGTDNEAGVVFNSNGTKLFVVDNGNQSTNTGASVREYSLATPYDVTNLTLTRETSLDGEWFNKSLNDVTLSADESKLYLSGHAHTISAGQTYGGYIYEFSVNESVLSNDTDGDGDSLTLTHIGSDAVASGTTYANGATVNGQYGVLTIGADGTYSYVADGRSEDPLNVGDTVTDSFTYTVSDGAASDTANLIVTVTGVNDVPETSDAAVTTDENTAIVLATANFAFSDVDSNDAMTHITIATQPANGTLQHYDGSNWVAVTDGQNITKADLDANNLRFTPTTDEFGAPYTSFTFTVNDGDADSTAATLTINVNEVSNATPTVSIAAIDPDIIEDIDASAQVLNASGKITFADDGTLTIVGAASTTVTSGAGVSIPTLAMQVALENAFSPDSISDNGDGTADWTLNTDGLDLDFLDAGQTITLDYVVTATDSDGLSVDTTITVTITGTNDTPTASDETVYINERNLYQIDGDRTPANTSYDFSPSDFASFSDAEDSAFSNLKITSLETDGALQYFNGSSLAHVTENQIISYADISGGLVFYPDRNAEGDVSFGFQLSDSAGVYSAEQTMTISVNAAPTASNYVEGGSGIDAGATDTGNIKDTQISDSDDTDDVLVLTGLIAGDEYSNWENSRADFITDGTGIGTNVVGLYGTLQMASNGDFTYTANASNDIPVGQTAEDDFTYTVRDDETNAGSYAYDVGTISFRVNGFNDAPVVAALTDSKTEDEAAFTTDLTAGQTDPDGDSLSVSGTPTITAVDGNGNSVTLPDGAASVSGNDLTVDPTLFNELDDGESVVITVAYDVSDGTTTTPNTATITVTGVNDAPVVSAITDSKTEDEAAFTTDLTAGQTDPDGDSLSVSGTPTITAVDGNGNSVTLPDGAASVTGDDLTVDPTLFADLDDGESVVITVAYDVSDGTTTTPNTATITVTGVNDAPVVAAITDSKTEDEAAFTTDLTAGQTDPDGDSLSVSGTPTITAVDGNGDPFTLPVGTASVTGNDLTVDPTLLDALDVGESVVITVAYDVSDGTTTTPNTATITVTGVNDAPTFGDTKYQSSTFTDVVEGPFTITELVDGHEYENNGTLTTGYWQRINDDGSQLDISVEFLSTTHSSDETFVGYYSISNPESGTSILTNGVGNYSFLASASDSDLDHLAAGESYTETFRITISDTNGATATHDIQVVISGANDAPVAADDAGNVSVGTQFTGLVLGNSTMGGVDTDPDTNDTLVVSALGSTTIADSVGATATAVGTYGTLVLGRDGAVTYDADQAAAAALNFGDAAVTDTFTYTVADPSGVTDTATITFSITAPDATNTAPTVSTIDLNKTEDDTAFDIDLIDDAAPVDADSDPVSLSGEVTLSFVDKDGNSVSLPAGAASVNGATLSIDPSVFNGLDTSENVVITANYSVTDGSAIVANTATITVAGVNDTPVTTPLTDAKTEDDAAFTTDLTGGQSDPDTENIYVDSYQPITAVDGNGDAFTLPDGTVTMSGDNLTIDPTLLDALDDGESAVISVNYNLSDGDEIVANTMTVTITGINDAPVVAAIDDTKTEDDAAFTTDLTAGQTDPDGDSLSVSGTPTITAVDGNGNSVTLPDGAASVSGDDLTVDPTLFADLDDGESVVISVTYDVSDGDTTTPNTATITVNGVNDAPVVSAITDTKTEDDAAFTTDLTAGQTDPDGDPLSVSGTPTITAIDGNGDAFTLPDGAASVTGNDLTVDPTLLDALGDGESVVITVAYDVSDGTTTTPNTATITVTGVNDAPVVSAITDSKVKTDASYTIDLLAGASDADTNDTPSISSAVGEEVTLSYTDKNGATVPLPDGAASITDATLTIDPGVFSDLTGSETVTITANYHVTDGTVSTPNTATITITGINDAPVVSAITDAKTEDDAAFTTDLLADQTDPNGDVLSIGGEAVISAIDGNGDAFTLPAGTASVTGGTLSLDPTLLDALDDGESVVITTTYDVSDGTTTTQNTATITVTGVNDAPTSGDVTLPISDENPRDLQKSDFPFTDVDGDEIDKITIVTAPSQGKLYLNGRELGDGDVVRANQIDNLEYQPGSGAAGDDYDNFTFTVNDGTADSATHTMTFDVSATPTVSDGTNSGNEDTVISGTLVGSDPDGDPVTFAITKQPQHGEVKLIDNGPGYTYTPDPHYHGPDDFEFTASDAASTSTAGKIALTVDSVNDAPVLRRELDTIMLMPRQPLEIKIDNMFGEIDAFDPQKNNFNNLINKLFNKGKFLTRDLMSPLPTEGQFTLEVTGLPDGLTRDGTKIIGSLSETGEHTVTVRATDGVGATTETRFKIVVMRPSVDAVEEKPTDPSQPDDTRPEESSPDLNNHGLPPVLKVNPKRDGTVPDRSEPIAPRETPGNMGDDGGLSDDSWMDTKVSTQQDVSGNIRVVDLDVKGDEIAVTLTDEAVDPAQRFKGEMADGSQLPDWVSVDPNTGLTTAEPPQGAGPLEMRVVAQDGSGNERAIDIILDPDALKNATGDSEKTPRELRREARQAEREARQAERQAERQAAREARQAEREARQVERQAKRAAKEFARTDMTVDVLADGRVQFNEGLTIAGEGSMKLMRMVSEETALKIEISDEQKATETRYEVRMLDGSIAPDWVEVDAQTGELTIEAPDDAGMLELQLVATQGGIQRSIELQVDTQELMEDAPSETEQTPEAEAATTDDAPQEQGSDTQPDDNELGFTPLEDQIDAALAAESSYGKDLQFAMQTRG